jgi:hypothetical protein
MLHTTSACVLALASLLSLPVTLMPAVHAQQPAPAAAQPANERRSDKVDVLDEALARVGERLDALDDGE